MFRNRPPGILAQMPRLEKIDASDRIDGTQRPRRLRQIPPETGQFLAILLANAPIGRIVEIVTNAAYSTLWRAHQQMLQPTIDRAVADERLDTLVVHIDKGILLCRKT